MLILTQLGFNVSAHKGHDTGSLKDLLSVTAQAILEVSWAARHVHPAGT